jgi:hypothetical protein
MYVCVCMYGCGTWSRTLREKHGLRDGAQGTEHKIWLQGVKVTDCYSDNQREEDNVHEAGSTHRRDVKCARNLSRKPEWRMKL